jgi:ketosteroid isomerase-like protein
MTEATIRQEILKLENGRCAALMAGDVDALGELLAEDLVHVHGNGQLDGKADYLNGVKTKYKFHRIERGDLNIRIYGDIVVVVGPLNQTVFIKTINKLNEISAVVTQTWVRRDGRWKQSTCHMGFLPVS